MLICRCEEITEEEIRQAVCDGAHTIDAVKRRTRSGMGLCQGHTCSKLIAKIISEETGKLLSEIKLPNVRPPLRPTLIKTISS